MSLQYDFRKIADLNNAFYTLPDDVRQANADDVKRLRPNAEALAWAAMAMDLSDITEKNINEWWFRLSYLRKTSAYQQFTVPKESKLTFSPFEISYSMLQSFVGFTCNVSTVSRTVWLNKMNKLTAMEVGRTLEAEIEKYDTPEAEKARKCAVWWWEQNTAAQERKQRNLPEVATEIQPA